MSILQGMKNIGQLGGYLGKNALMGGFGNTAAGAAWGGLAGGAYGAVSNDTSVLGGMLGGAALGAGGARYGGAGLREGLRRYKGFGYEGATGVKGFGVGFGKGVQNIARMDYRGARMATNRAANSIRGLGRGIVPIGP